MNSGHLWPNDPKYLIFGMLERKKKKEKRKKEKRKRKKKENKTEKIL